MSDLAGVVRVEDSTGARAVRFTLWFLLVASWAVAVAYMWDAVSTTPMGGEVDSAWVAETPPYRALAVAAIFSGLELAVVLVTLWPWRAGFYDARLGVMGLALVTWFIMTTPVSVSRVDQVHRHWLAFMIAAVLLAFILLAVHRLVRRLLRRAPAP